MKRKILALVLVLTLLAGCMAVFADQNRYNKLETEGSTIVTLKNTEYWQWTVPEKVELQFTTRSTAKSFGYVSIENVVLAEGYGDRVITVTAEKIGNLELQNVYLVYQNAEGKYSATKSEEFNKAVLKTLKKDEIPKEMKDVFTDSARVKDSICAVTKEEAIDGWSLAMQNVYFMRENVNEGQGPEVYGIEKIPGSEEYLGFMVDKCEDETLLEWKSAKVKDGQLLLAVRTDCTNGDVYKVEEIANKITFNGGNQKATEYKQGQQNNLFMEKTADSIVEGSIQGVGLVGKTDLSYYCWGSPKYVGTYEGKVTYTADSKKVDLLKPVRK